MAARSSPGARRSRPYRIAKAAVVGLGATFWVLWGLATVLLIDGHPFSAVPGCSSMDEAGLFWECAQGKAEALGATGVNAIMALTIAMPVFAIAAYFDAFFLQIALPGILFNLLGLPAAMFLLVRGALNAMEYLRYR